jgi:hypothetical protein
LARICSLVSRLVALTTGLTKGKARAKTKAQEILFFIAVDYSISTGFSAESIFP